MNKKYIFIFGIVLLLLIISGLFYSFYLREYHMTLTQEELQRRIESKFPVSKKFLFLNSVIFSQPEVKLKEGSDRIDFKVHVETQLVKEIPLIGIAQISGDVRYDSTQKEFYLDNSKLESLQLGGVPDHVSDKLKKVVGILITDHLNKTPVYRLKPKTLKRFLLREILQKVEVKNGEMELTLGPS